MSEETRRLVSIELDEGSLGAVSADAEHERRVAIFDLLEGNVFEIENAYVRAITGSEKKFFTSRFGVFHPWEGFGAYRSMEMALKKAGMVPADIDYINAHGTSTMADTIELGAVRRLFGNAIGKVSMSSTKSAIGHLLGGAGAVESIFCILALRDQIVPPTLNLENPSEGCEGVDLVPFTAKKRQVRAVLNNSFGFGGTNASLVMKAV